MLVYKNLLKDGLNGFKRSDRTGTGTRTVIGPQLSIDLRNGFPLLTTKKVWFKGVVRELLWFMSGSTNINDLHPTVKKWWEPWAEDNGDLGPIYGSMLRGERWVNDDGVVFIKDQLNSTIRSLRTDPDSRRHVISLWNGAAMEEARLPCCHGTVIQFISEHSDNKRILHLSTYQRSGDIFIGVPVNIASYALLTHIMAALTNHSVGTMTYTFGEAHLYENHVEQAELQLTRVCKKLPKLCGPTTPLNSVDDITEESFQLIKYHPGPAIKGDVAV